MSTTRARRTRTTYAVAAMLIVAALVSSGVLVAMSGSRTTTVTVQSTVATLMTTTTTITLVSTSFVPMNASGDPSLLPRCAATAQVNQSAPVLVAGTTSPAILCLRLYEFNPNAPLVLDVSKLLQIHGSKMTQGGVIEQIDSESNFTIASSAGQILMGGPDNFNEGTLVAYAISAKPGTSGTYQVGIGGWIVQSQPIGCASFFELVVGNGLPKDTLIGSCIEVTTTSGQTYRIPGVSSSVFSDMVYFKIVAMMNSTSP